ncbi:putative effector of murein hydrolase LrgA (UPF0299 family) [Hoeflea halophila]|uniref:Putative effector of murein hydrolase LrgA (UPF0299 family) n=1 Tax=Hoeflea halophila TaxID=714899 RepID=A0A286IF59_9HYPH|nr:CidA/LrgA family protein [Hoeflea halophila]SOE18775.1 putative effector of murein hydrolase LrgA (UPF0299 family) [Hoeflea halophila]
MLSALTLILSCQLVGELVTRFLGLPVPGPVAGMVLLFVLLLVKGTVPKDVGAVADSLLRHLALLFVPAGVGVMAHLDLLGQDWLPITAALVGSTLATIAVTALVMSWLARPISTDNPEKENG